MKFKKAIIVTPLAFLFMSAEKSCQQEAPRTLKRIVQIESINAAPILANDQTFDYKFVANQQMPGVLFDTNLFYHRTKMPGQDNIKNGDGGYFGVSKMVSSKTLNQLQSWYPSMKAEDFAISEEATCMLSRPQYHLAGSINAMELWGGGKIQLGFNSQTSVSGVGLNAGIDKARMQLSMSATNPLTYEVRAAVNVEQMKNDYSVGFSIPLGIINLGTEFYRRTGMSEVTEKGLKKGVQALFESLKADPWYTRVFMNMDREVVITGAAEINLRVGDQLKVVNEKHIWRGRPCAATSIYEGSYPTDQEWIVEVVALGDGFSRAKVLGLRPDSNIAAGARVTLYKMAEQVEKEKKDSGKKASEPTSEKTGGSSSSSGASEGQIVGQRR